MSEDNELDKKFAAQQKPIQEAVEIEETKPAIKKGKKMSGLMIAAIAVLTASVASLLTVVVYIAIIGGF